MPQYSDKDLFLKWWGDAWTEGLWAASWSKSLDGLSAADAAWQPSGRDGRPHHSIWQNVEHLIFWRENWLGRLDGGPQPGKEEIRLRNFPQPAMATEESWAALRRKLQTTHEQVAAAVRDRYDVAAPMMWFLPHDAYHMGQINYIRSLLGLAAIE